MAAVKIEIILGLIFSKERVAPMISNAIGRARLLSISMLRSRIIGKGVPDKEKIIPRIADIIIGFPSIERMIFLKLPIIET